jgi:MSHA biogenesis protein MshP
MKMPSHKQHRGFSMITAIFLLVVLGTLGAMMVTFFTAQQQSSALDVTGSRAYQASRAGVEWAAYNVLNTAPAALWPGCAAGAVFTPGTATALAGTLAPFSVTVVCRAAPFVDGASSLFVYTITSTAVAGGVPGDADYVARVITVTMRGN